MAVFILSQEVIYLIVYWGPENTIVIMNILIYPNSSEAYFTGIKMKTFLHNICRDLIKPFFISGNDKNTCPILYWLSKRLSFKPFKLLIFEIFTQVISENIDNRNVFLFKQFL